MSEHPNAPETRTVDVDVQSLDTRGRTVVGWAAVYDVTSEDLGGFREVIKPGAFADVLDGDVRALLNHDPSQVLGRTKSGTLRLADDERGLRFEVDLPESRDDLREAVARGDLDGASFRFAVGDEEWDDNVRTVKTVKSLSDLSLATYPAYPQTSIELRTRPEPESEATVPTDDERGGLTVEDRAATPATRSLADEFRAAGFDGETPATIGWREFEARALTLAAGTTVDQLAPVGAAATALGFDRRYAWPVFPSSPVDEGATSVEVLRQKGRTLPAAADVVRAIDAVTEKPEVSSEIELVSEPLKQIAAKQSGIANILLSQPAIGPIINTDLRLAINEGLDKLALDEVAAVSGPRNGPALGEHPQGDDHDSGGGLQPGYLGFEAVRLRVSGHAEGDAGRDTRRGRVRVQPRPVRAEPVEPESPREQVGGESRGTGQSGVRSHVPEPGQPAHLRGKRRRDEYEPGPA